MKKLFFLFLVFLPVSQASIYADEDLVDLIIECYEEYYLLLEAKAAPDATFEKKEICMPEPANFYEYFRTDFIDFASLREGDVSAFSFRDSLHSPLRSNLIITSNYGKRKREKHFGVDFRLAVGDTVCSVFCGKVRVAKFDENYGYVVVVRHYNMSESVYAHLSRMLVKVDQIIEVGQPIGLGGSTGRSTGPHLHFELRYKGFPINPIVEDKFLKKLPVRSTVKQE